MKRLWTIAIALVLLAACFGTGAAPAKTTPGHASVIDRSIGPVAIGAARTTVEARIGPPSSTLAVSLGNGKTGVLARYLNGSPINPYDETGARLQGTLIVAYDETGHVVAVETASPLYRTAGGAAPARPSRLSRS